MDTGIKRKMSFLSTHEDHHAMLISDTFLQITFYVIFSFLFTDTNALGFMENYTTKMCDFDPTSTKKILPQGITVASMYREFKDIETEDLACLSYFYFIWKRHMSQCVSITRRVSQFDFMSHLNVMFACA